MPIAERAMDESRKQSIVSALRYSKKNEILIYRSIGCVYLFTLPSRAQEGAVVGPRNRDKSHMASPRRLNHHPAQFKNVGTGTATGGRIHGPNTTVVFVLNLCVSTSPTDPNRGTCRKEQPSETPLNGTESCREMVAEVAQMRDRRDPIESIFFSNRVCPYLVPLIGFCPFTYLRTSLPSPSPASPTLLPPSEVSTRGRTTGSSRNIGEDEIYELVSRLEAALPELHRKSTNRVGYRVRGVERDLPLHHETETRGGRSELEAVPRTRNNGS
ncbi:hypothetical protein H6P81_011216 [Aristolochia fimbriata]|uniref:Uncharacterized protein n=1 Tax=Aristolochia fimbriata TaxID=158543 RepID=A0AAV7ES15_ARIFI|nr:hypothetical protein H6P81_011216 [Aristolochia fimbriata]